MGIFGCHICFPEPQTLTHTHTHQSRLSKQRFLNISAYLLQQMGAYANLLSRYPVET